MDIYLMYSRECYLFQEDFYKIKGIYDDLNK